MCKKFKIKPIVTVLTLFLSIFIVSCKEPLVSKNDHFILNSENISSWVEIKQGVSIKLNDKGSKDFFDITKKNLNKPIEIYVENLLISSPMILQATGSGGMVISMDMNMKRKALLLLPPSKKQL